MSSKINKIFIILFICLTLLLILSLKVDAANASITVDKSTVEVGKPVKITVSGKGVQWNLKLKVDGEVLKTDSELENYEANKNINFSVTYTPKSEGTKKVTIEGSVTEFSDGSTIKNFDSKTITVKAKETTTDKKEDTTTDKNTSSSDKGTTTTDKNTTTTPEKPKEKSNNAYLSTLGITPKEYDFSGFSKTKTSYSVTIPKNVDSLKVLYKTADSNAKVKVSGNSGFEVGSDNKITIKVTAEDGKTTKTYTIKVTQLAEEEEKPGNLIEEDTGLFLTFLSIEGVELSPEFAKDTYSYITTLEDYTVNELKVTAEANNEKAKIDVSGNTNLVEGENTINIIVTVDDSDAQAVYQIVVTKIAAPIVNLEGEQTSSTMDILGLFKGYLGIAIIVFLLMIVAVVILIVLLRKENKKNREDDDEYEDEDVKAEEYNVYNNDENEFSNIMQKDNFIESLYKQRNGDFDDETLSESEKEILEEITKQTEEIFTEKVQGQSVEYESNELYTENPLEVRKRRRNKGKHSM